MTFETIDSVIFSIVDALDFKFTAAQGLVAAQQYHIRVRAKNFHTNYYSLNGPWSAE